MIKSIMLALGLFIILADGIYPSPAELDLPEDHPKYLTAKGVFDNLVRSVGDSRTKPELVLSTRSNNTVAQFDPRQNVIRLSERAYDLMTSLGADSLDGLAFLLGHELFHCYEENAWIDDLYQGFVPAPIDKQQESQTETKADFYSGLYGYIAGYRPLDAASSVLEKIYADYNVNENDLSYPPLAKRKEDTQEAKRRLSELVPFFEAGNGLLLVKQYKEAARCFDYIGRIFASREILNNAGLARAFEALSLMDQNTVRFAYPFEIDAQTRLGIKSDKKAAQYGPDFDEVQEEVDRLLEEARERFEKARQKDAQYATTYINLACVSDLQGEYEDALFYARRALKVARQMEAQISVANALVIRAISTFRVDPTNERAVRRDLEAAQKSNSLLASLNLGVLTSLSPTAAQNRERFSSEPETIGTLGIRDYGQITDRADMAIYLPSGAGFQSGQIFVKKRADWRGLAIEFGYRTVAFLQTGENYIGKSGRGIGMGDDLSLVTQRYGQPSYLVEGRKIKYHIYDLSKIIFQTDVNNRVVGWMLYTIME